MTTSNKPDDSEEDFNNSAENVTSSENGALEFHKLILSKQNDANSTTYALDDQVDNNHLLETSTNPSDVTYTTPTTSEFSLPVTTTQPIFDESDDNRVNLQQQQQLLQNVTIQSASESESDLITAIGTNDDLIIIDITTQVVESSTSTPQSLIIGKNKDGTDNKPYNEIDAITPDATTVSLQLAESVTTVNGQSSTSSLVSSSSTASKDFLTTEKTGASLETYSQVVPAKSTRDLVEIGVKNALSQNIFLNTDEDGGSSNDDKTTSEATILVTTISFIVLAILCSVALAGFFMSKQLSTLRIDQTIVPE